MTVGQWIVIGYALTGLLAARGVYAWERADWLRQFDTVDLGETVMMGFLAFLLGWFWPLLFVIAAIVWKPRKYPAEREKERREREEYVRKLERELGIHDR